MSERGIYLGLGHGGWAWSGKQHSTLVLGPSRSGKTSCLVIPNILASPGAVVSTSTKPDVMRATAFSKVDSGYGFLFDPSGEIEAPPGVHRIGWSPLRSSETFEGALSTADAMVRAAGAEHTTYTGQNHWIERASALLAPLLYGAAIQKLSMADLLHWVDRHDGADALNILCEIKGDFAPATDVLAGILATDEREQSGIWSTASGVLSAYRSQSVLESTKGPFLDVSAFCEGKNVLYICSPSARQMLFAPLVVGFLGEIRDAAYGLADKDGLDAPVLLALDEVANIAPLPDLPSLVSEGAGQGVLTLACLQDLSQARRRWGRQADSFFSLFGSAVILPGIADPATLAILSDLGGDIEIPMKSIAYTEGHDGKVRPSQNLSSVFKRRLPHDEISHGHDGMALAIDAHKRPGWIRLTPAHRTPPWNHLLAQRERPSTSRASLFDLSRSSPIRTQILGR